jgi:hypothetical protein
MGCKSLGKFHYTILWRVDCDYAEKLSPTEKNWLKKFLGEFYDHRFTNDPVHPNKAQAYKDSYTRENAAGRCVMNKLGRSEKDLSTLSKMPNPIKRKD